MCRIPQLTVYIFANKKLHQVSRLHEGLCVPLLLPTHTVYLHVANACSHVIGQYYLTTNSSETNILASWFTGKVCLYRLWLLVIFYKTTQQEFMQLN